MNKRGRAADFVEQLNLSLNSMIAQRSPYDTVWQKVAVFLSDRNNMFTGSPTANNSYMALYRDHRDIDNTARKAIQIFGSGMLSGVTPPSDQWFTLRVADTSGGQELRKWKPVASWLESVEKIFAQDFIAKNFYTQQVSSYKHIGLFGMQAMYVGFHPEVGTYYRDIPIDEIYITNDYAGRVNTVFRDMQISYQQAIELFGLENLSPTVQEQTRTKDFDVTKPMRVVHAVYKKSPGYENILGGNKLPYVSFYFEPEENHLIEEKGFESLPYIVTRAYSDGRSPYSISPGTVALADVLMVNQLKTLMLQAGQLSVAPPMLMPDQGLVGRMNYQPSALITYRKDGTTSVDDFKPLQLAGEFKLGYQLMEAAQNDINQAFFVDLFLMIHNRVSQGTSGATGTPTATEIQQLATEKSFLLAPILINQQQENFNRLFERMMELMSKQPGKLPPAPEELRNAELDIHYVSPLVRAQQSVQTKNILESLNDMMQIAQGFPEVIDLVDSDRIMRRLMENRGMPQSCVLEEEEVELKRFERQQQQMQAQQAMQQQQMLENAMGGYEGLSKAPEAGSPAQSLMSQIMGGA